MRHDDLMKPISPDAPCGDDLLETDDEAFVDYYFNVEDRLPTAYFNILRGTLFDSKTVDHKAETAQIDALLKRSRDLRLLVLEAKFQILAGRFKGFVDAVMAVAGLLETYPEDVHPRGDSDRRNALEELNAQATVVTPLDYAPLLTDRRYGDVTYRPYATGTGKMPVREGEEPGDSGGITAALGNSENAAAVETLAGQLSGMLEALTRITAVCRSGAKPFSPTLTRLTEKLGDLLAMVMQARGDLTPAAAAPAEADAEAAPAGQITFTAPAPGEVADQRAAFRILGAVERYFAAHEPASLALVLVTQSRLLIGRPLVEALDVMVEDTANRATIDFGSDTGFSISMSRMRQLSEAAGIPTADTWGEDDTPPPEVVSRDHAGQLLKTIEDYYRTREPASPIPILLFKARNLLSKDFHALVRELLPPDTYR